MFFVIVNVMLIPPCLHTPHKVCAPPSWRRPLLPRPPRSRCRSGRPDGTCVHRPAPKYLWSPSQNIPAPKNLEVIPPARPPWPLAGVYHHLQPGWSRQGRSGSWPPVSISISIGIIISSIIISIIFSIISVNINIGFIVFSICISPSISQVRKVSVQMLDLKLQPFFVQVNYTKSYLVCSSIRVRLKLDWRIVTYSWKNVTMIVFKKCEGRWTRQVVTF